MDEPKTPQSTEYRSTFAGKIFQIMLLLAALEGLAAAFLIGQTRSAEGGVLFGLSAFRLALAGVILLLSALFLAAAWLWRRSSKLTDRLENFIRTNRTWLALAFFWLGMLLFLLVPEAYFQIFFKQIKTIDTALFYQRLRPFVGWAALVSIELSIAAVLAFRTEFTRDEVKRHPLIVWLILGIDRATASGDRMKFKSRIQHAWRNYRSEGLVWAALVLTWGLIAVTRVGIKPDDRFWNVGGVPVLPQQIILSTLLLLFLLDLRQLSDEGKLARLINHRSAPYVLMGVLWLGTFIFWQGIELRHTYFAPGPYPPNHERYPFSDARFFDIGAQSILNGNGLYFNNTTDRPFLMIYVALLHWLGGQVYNQYIPIQVAVLALIPVLVFAIGWKMHSKTAGLGMALFVILQEGNAIKAASEIGLVNAKVLMSEMPTALLLTAAAICLFQWLEKRETGARLSPVLTGGLLGLAVGFRGNTLALFPVVIVIALLKYLPGKKGIRDWAVTSALFVLSFTLVLTPYSVRTYRQDGAPFWLTKITNVLERSAVESVEEIEGYKQPKLVDPADERLKQSAANPGPLTYSLNHFVHNEITSIMIFPLTWTATPLETAAKQPIWDSDQTWLGELTTGEKIGLGMNLLVLSFGIGFAARRQGILGLSPLAIHLIYNLTNAVSRKSGGRYLVPTGWVMIVYFLLGIFSIYYILRGWQPQLKPAQAQAARRPAVLAAALAGFLLLGSSFLVADLIPAQFTANEPTARAALFEEYGQEWMHKSGLSINEIKTFTESDQGVIKMGMSLYPRYYPADEAPPRSSHMPSMPDGHNRVTFLLMERERVEYVHLGLGEGSLKQFPHASFGLLLGCLQEGYIDGIVFIPMTGDVSSVIEQADLSLSCGSP